MNNNNNDIQGNANVSRNVSVGGNVNVQGRMRVGHCLRVDGWLEAPNIKDVNKGLFETEDALKEAYPAPHDGWFAGVAASDGDIAKAGLTVEEGKALYWMYTGSGGVWQRMPPDKLYQIVVDNMKVEELEESCTQLQGDVAGLAERADGHDAEIAAIKDNQSAHDISINKMKSRIDGHDTDIADIGIKLAAHANGISALKERADGHDTEIAAVREKLTSIDTDIDDVRQEIADAGDAHNTVRFAAFVPEVIQIENQGAVPGVSGDVVYMQARRIFALRCPIDKYYLSWHNDGNTDTMYNESPRQIRKDKVFVCGGKTYVWSDDAQDLVETSADKADKSMFRTLSESEYESLSRKDEDTYYFIYE